VAPAYRPERIRRLRGDRPQYVVAFEAGLTQGHLSAIEHGRIESVGIEILSSLADALNTSVEYLIGRTNIPRPIDQIIPEDALEADEQDLLSDYRAIQSPGLRAAARDAVRGLRVASDRARQAERQTDGSGDEAPS